MRLKERIALVTGGSRGIGKAIAKAFVREGATAVICSRKTEPLAAAAEEIGAIGIPCHVGRAEDLQRLVDSVHERFGRIDILVNNAATNVAHGPCLTVDDGQFDKMMEVNLKSAFRLTRLVAPGMCDRREGSIINIASISGIRPQCEGLLYSATKAALIMMTQVYALELGSSGVRVNAIAPGLIRTALSEYYWKNDERLGALLGRQPIRHLGEPEEIAEVAVMLAARESSFLTGQTIVVDGGATLPTI
jgi:NAD(P)-dependent dehydrogenase (short-subunit alcohol dehydrogenase family)